MITTTDPRLRDIVGLALGRGVFRLSSQLAAISLVAVWGERQFGHYANAMGVVVWLVFVPTAAEKTALKTMPRTPMLAPSVARLTLGVALAPVAALTVALIAVLVVAPRSTAGLYLAAATWAAATGLLMTISGLHRLRGRPLLDAQAFGVLTAVVLTGTAATWLAGWSVTTHLLVQVGGIAVVIVVSVARLPIEWIRRPASSPRRLLPAYGRSASLLGVSELLDVAGMSVVYLVLATSGRVVDSGPLFVALVVSGVAGSFLLYLLKLYQPAVSARLRGMGGAGGRASARRLLRTGQWIGLGFTIAVAAIWIVPAGRAILTVDDGAALYVMLGLVVVVEIAVSFVVTIATFALENTNSSLLRITATTAGIGFVAVTVFAVLLVPPLGAIGGLVALVLATTVKAGVLRRLLLRRHPELHPSMTASPH